MFRESLLESSPVARRNKRWPMATAFTVQLIVAGILIVVPLLSTGVIPVFAHPPIYTPLKQVEIERVQVEQTTSSGPSTGGSHTTAVTLLANNTSQLYVGPPRERTDNPTPPDLGPSGPSDQLDRIGREIGKNGPGPRLGPRRVRVSILSEARLVNRVEPIYPKIAIISGIRGEVKLHAIIARDGSIQSLNVTSGHPILAAAALDAVRQWRYQPYILNGDPVEVDTLITVNFKRTGD